MKEVIFNHSALQRIRKGINITSDAVSGTLGAKGRNVFLDDSLMPNITNDGATIAQHVILEDKFENMGAWMVKNAAAQTNEVAGDGTTTTTVLLRALVDQCLAQPEHPMAVEKSLKAASIDAVKAIAKRARKISAKKDVERVALISSKSPEISGIIADIVSKKGKDILITVDDSRTFGTYYDLTEGYEAQVGYYSPYFVNDVKGQKAVYSDIAVLCSEKRISSLGDIKPLFDQLDKAKITSLVIVCEEIEPSVLGLLIQNKRMGLFNCLVIRATGLLLEDIAAATSSTLVSERTGVSFGNIDIKKHLGKVDKVVSEPKKTLFVANHPSARNQIKILEAQIKMTLNDIEKKSLYKRIAKLRGGVAVIHVGAPTDFEREYLKYKAEDAINAVKSALDEGVVEGGGLALYSIAEAMKPKTTGEKILKKVLKAPLRTIIENAGEDYAEIIKYMPKGQGYDAELNTYRDMFEAGIIDPAKVERAALENSVGVVSKFITMHCAIADLPKKDEQK